MIFLFEELLNRISNGKLLKYGKFVIFLFFILLLKVEVKSENSQVFRFCKELKMDANKILASDNNIAFLSSSKAIYSIDLNSFIKNWEYEFPGKLYFSPTLTSDKIIIETYIEKEKTFKELNNNFEITRTIINTQTGIPTEVSQFNKQEIITENLSTLNLISYNSTNYGEPVIFQVQADRTVFGYKNGVILFYSKGSNRFVWKTKVGGEITSISYIQNKILISSKDNFLYLLNSKSGNIIWRKRMPERILNVFILQNTLIATSTANTEEISLVGLESGNEIGKILHKFKGRLLDIKKYSKNGLILLTDSNLILYNAEKCGN